jgi:Zn-dependent peptidase ImmA (M78 family)
LDGQQGPLEPLLSRLNGRSLKEIANDNATPLLAVARSSGKLGPQAIAEMIREFRTLPPGPITELVKRRRALAPIIKGAKTHTEQGIRAAMGIREWLGVPKDALLDLQNVSDRLGITVQQHFGLDSRIDGLASAGPEHGPAILLNRNTARRGASDADLERSLRFTWAHELGHLLLDNDGWPAITDSAQQRVPRLIETRANAFAAYLLVLPEVAYQALDDEKPGLVWNEVEPALNKIGDRFKVSRIVLARQVSRGAPFGRERDWDMIFRQNIPYFKHSPHV